jgi:hypothetical protein
VDTVAQLREVIAWARANPRIRRFSFQPLDDQDYPASSATRN